jgi:hypothetical protein
VKPTAKMPEEWRLPPQERNQKVPTTFTGNQLRDKVFPPFTWAVPDILPAGVTLFGGREKMGKSWLAFGLCIAVASGGVALGTKRVEAGDALYLSLEDGERRMHRRINKLASADADLSRFHYKTEWEPADRGGVEDLDAWLEDHPDTRLVVIDTLKRIRPWTSGRRNMYDDDCDSLQPFVPLGNKHNVACMVIHHLNQQSNPDDPFDWFSGSAGLVAAAEGILLFRRKRGDGDAYLTVDGKDIEERTELALKWDPLASTLDVTDSAGLTIDGRGANITVSGGGSVRVFSVGSGATLDLRNLAVAGGNTNGEGGGIFNAGTLTVTNSTFSGNTASAGDAIYNGGLTSNVALRNTIVASPRNNNCGGAPPTDNGGNLDDGATCRFTAPTSKSSTPAGLDPAGLKDNGGPTETIALCSGVDTPAGCTGPSAAIDAAVNCPPPATDQRGVSRPQGSACDIGSFELQGSTYDFAGFFSPVDNATTNNEVKAGRAIPVKFSLGGDQGLDIFESGYPNSVEMPCESTASVDAIEQTPSDNSSHLTYDATTDTYTYVWKTNKGWADTCRQLVVKLNDGSTHVANFTFVK